MQEVDAEFFLLFYNSNENSSPYFSENFEQYIGGDFSAFNVTKEFMHDNEKHCMCHQRYLLCFVKTFFIFYEFCHYDFF